MVQAAVAGRVVRHAVTCAAAAADPGRRRDRGDVPGWVMVTVMSAGLVVVIFGRVQGQDHRRDQQRHRLGDRRDRQLSRCPSRASPTSPPAGRRPGLGGGRVLPDVGRCWCCCCSRVLQVAALFYVRSVAAAAAAADGARYAANAGVSARGRRPARQRPADPRRSGPGMARRLPCAGGLVADAGSGSGDRRGALPGNIRVGAAAGRRAGARRGQRPVVEGRTVRISRQSMAYAGAARTASEAAPSSSSSSSRCWCWCR